MRNTEQPQMAQYNWRTSGAVSIMTKTEKTKMNEYNREQLIAKGTCEVCTVESAVAIVKVAREETLWAEGMGACGEFLPQVTPSTSEFYGGK